MKYHFLTPIQGELSNITSTRTMNCVHFSTTNFQNKLCPPSTKIIMVSCLQNQAKNTNTCFSKSKKKAAAAHS